MKTYLSLLLLLLAGSNLAAQFGVNATYNLNDAPKWQIVDLSNNSFTEVPGSGVGFGLDYWIPLRGARIELLPELNYAQYQATAVDLGTLSSQFISFFLKANLYLLDLKGDCQCPTFSKSGSTLSKGFFLQIAPGVTYLDTDIDMFNGSRLLATALLPSIAVGGGVDLGVSDLFTLTPFGGIRLFPAANWQGLEESLRFDPSLGNRQVSNVGNLTQIYLGLRLGLRFDDRR